MDIKYETLSAIELLEIVNQLKLKRRNCSALFNGFHYFGSDDFGSRYGNNNDINFIIAINENTIIGVLKYSLELSDYDLCNEIKINDLYTLMRYIDVHEDYKGLRIGTKLIQKLNQTIDKTIPILISEETDDGKMIGSHKMFTKHLDNVLLILRDYFCGLKKIDKTFAKIL